MVTCRAVDKMHKAQAVLNFFTTNEYEFVEENLKNLQDEMHEDDRRIFNFDIADLNWADFLDDWTKVGLQCLSDAWQIQGTRQYVFKEPLSSLESSRVAQDRLYWIEAVISVGSVCFSYFLNFRSFSTFSLAGS